MHVEAIFHLLIQIMEFDVLKDLVRVLLPGIK